MSYLVHIFVRGSDGGRRLIPECVRAAGPNGAINAVMRRHKLRAVDVLHVMAERLPV